MSEKTGRERVAGLLDQFMVELDEGCMSDPDVRDGYVDAATRKWDTALSVRAIASDLDALTAARRAAEPLRGPMLEYARLLREVGATGQELHRLEQIESLFGALDGKAGE